MSHAQAEGATHEGMEHRDDFGARMGMWLFLFTEILLFGGLFLLYSVYRSTYPEEFHKAGGELDHVLGVVNTVVLLTSSLTMACSITAIQKGNSKLSAVLVAVTVLLALVFLVNKYFEWGHKIHRGLYPSGPQLATRSHGEILFFGLYFTTTGFHGLHVMVGATLLTVMCILVMRGRIRQDDHVLLENSGLYWHLVDAVWIFILPLYYLAV